MKPDTNTKIQIAESVAIIKPLDKIYQRNNNGRVKVTAEVISVFNKYRQISTDLNEAGGVLLGRLIVETSDIVIDYNTAPMKGDRRSRYSFNRAKNKHQIIIQNVWNNSNGTCNYLGEWHTHPEENPIPSGIDLKNWERIMKETDYDDYNLFFIITGINKVNIWEGDKSSFTFNKLKELK